MRSQVVCVSVFHPTFAYQLKYAAYRIFKSTHLVWRF